MQERLQKYLARCGVASRRSCENLIEQGRVRVNGQVASLGCSLDPAADEVRVDERKIVPPTRLQYWLLHKPLGYVTTVSDPQGRETVMKLMPRHLPRLYPVGRLDRDSSGLLLFTNDGELTHKLLHPSSHVWKVYHCGLHAQPSEEVLQRLREGLNLEDGPTAPCRARWHRGCLEIELREGRKRQVRRMLASLGYPVQWLRRVGFGPLKLDGLAEGECRPLTEAEVQQLHG